MPQDPLSVIMSDSIMQKCDSDSQRQPKTPGYLSPLSTGISEDRRASSINQRDSPPVDPTERQRSAVSPAAVRTALAGSDEPSSPPAVPPAPVVALPSPGERCETGETDQTRDTRETPRHEDVAEVLQAVRRLQDANPQPKFPD